MPYVALLKFFADPKVILIIIVLALCGGGYWKYTDMKDTIETQEALIKKQKADNKTLSDNVKELTSVNDANKKVIDQLSLTISSNNEAVAKLSKDLKIKSASLNNAQARLNQITDKPVPLTNYLKEAIKEVQGAAP